MIDFEAINNNETAVDKINRLIESTPVSSYVDWLSIQKRIEHRRNLSYADMEHRLKMIFKSISPDIFIDRRKTFNRIKKQLLKKHDLSETKLSHFLKCETMLEENCRYIREMLNS